MRTELELKDILWRIDGGQYPQYRKIGSRWRFGDFELHIDRVQGDPYASPTRVRVRTFIDLKVAIRTVDEKIAAEDWILRVFGDALTGRQRGSGRSGLLRILQPGPEVVERTAVRILDTGLVEFRFRVGLPARGRRILGKQAWEMFSDDIPNAINAVEQAGGIRNHIDTYTRQRSLRAQLPKHNLVAFIENGSILPRKSGVDHVPLSGAVPIRSPETLATTLYVGEEAIEGLGIPTGITVIVGGGYHGKSTLLSAIQSGHLDHIAGDGREGVVTVVDGVKVRAEDGRSISNVDISMFLRDLPGGRSTQPFSTVDASGSTSEAAHIVEAMEAGATLLLLDEDSSATNLLVRDERMWALIGRSHEPITPFIEHIRSLYKTMGVSTILVIGGVADYLGVADTVIGLMDFEVVDMSGKAASLQIAAPPDIPFSMPDRDRVLRLSGIHPGKIKVHGGQRILFGAQTIPLDGVEQIVSEDQAWSIAQAIRWIHENGHPDEGLPSALDRLESTMERNGVECLCPWDEPCGEIVRPRRHEIAAVINRIRRPDNSESDTT